MKPGQASQTAVMVGMARALAHGSMQDVGFSDPTALALLPEQARRRVEGWLAGGPPKAFRERFERHGYRVDRDESLPTLAAERSRMLQGGTRPMTHVRIAIADHGSARARA